MSLRSTITRLGIVAAAGALVTSAAVTPALADNDWGSGDSDTGRPDNQQSQQSQQGQESGHSWQGQQDQQDQQDQQSQESGQDWQGQDNQQSGEQGGHDGNHDGNQRLARGVVTASELNLRSAPNRGSQVIRVAHRGDRVSIFCKTPGQSVDGDRLWYLLTDGTWAWGSARYIETVGTPPRWC
ncbi:SH3 domain-containing protein [Streptomyces gilvus]|uniref:SH3 domain-containing protein n=1 Tax=Streptomyces gilvus TaxID=2920937 RepID=UPI001F0EE6FD|nr:SH3 domain-containing protein [Streptomyces sp. CME 23]MCH5676434.1 SH3 domain-containing protein [Streptomyces sp. CME 23]